MKGFTLGLALKQRRKATQKSPIGVGLDGTQTTNITQNIYTLLMKDQMVAGAFGCATNYECDDPFNDRMLLQY